jgi:hypothetical protein
MPDGNQIGLFCCQTRRFRKEVAATSRQWNVSCAAFAWDVGLTGAILQGKGDGVIETISF